MSEPTNQSQREKCGGKLRNILGVALFFCVDFNQISGCNFVEAFTILKFHHTGRTCNGDKSTFILKKLRKACEKCTNMPSDDSDFTSQKMGSNTENSQLDNIVFQGQICHDPWDDADPDVEIKNPEIEGCGGSSSSSLVCEKKLVYDGAGTLGDIMSHPNEGNDKEKRDESIETLGSIKPLNKNPAVSNPLTGDSKSSTPTSSMNLMQNGTPATTTESWMERAATDEIERDISSFLKRSNNKQIKSGLVTSVGGTLQSQFGHKVPNLSPLDRIALTANGNMQRIVSSFYDSPVHVYVEKCKQRDSTTEAVWDRTVHLSVFNQVFCKATSVITIHSLECIELVQSEAIGIGQLFRQLDKLPTFALLDAGRTREGGLWRSYRLQCQELTCNIREELSDKIWEIKPTGLDELDNTF